MANVQNEPEAESDEDCEVYFLKPVNEYNIIDRIKEANKELFGNDSKLDNELTTAETQHIRKVSFAENLEEYEPQNGINLNELEIKLGIDCKENYELQLKKIKMENHLEIIAEEEPVTGNKVSETCETQTAETVAEDQIQKVCEDVESIEEAEQNQLIKASAICPPLDENVILEEICEEILIMDMENDKFEETFVTKVDKAPGSWQQRKMLKQITFDYTNEDDDEVDNKSLTNLLISDNENDTNNEDDEFVSEEYNYNESINGGSDTEDKTSATITEYYQEDEEDDKLSIIVASYLNDDMAGERTSLTSSNIKYSPLASKARKLPFNKRFSFRRKTRSSNSIGFCSNHLVSNNRRFTPPPEVTDLKLHYKTCCEFKKAQQNLPKYSGYISEYGLSREQLIKRELKLQQKQQGKVVQLLKISEKEMRKMHDNERAFTAWLKNKMRFPINKTRNMFDVRRPFGLRKYTNVEGNTTSDDTKQILEPNKPRSISAKLKKRISKT